MSRVLHLTSPHTKGADVTHLQEQINLRLERHHGAEWKVAVDGEYGPATRHAELRAAYLLGLDDNASREHVQNSILHPHLLSPSEVHASHHRVAEEIKRQKSGPEGLIALAHKLIAQRIVEEPPASNTGPLIDVMEHECGIHAAPWCGCAYRYLALHGGGIVLDQATRHCPSIEGMARAGTGGFKEWLPVSAWPNVPLACAVVYNFGGSVDEHTEALIGHDGFDGVGPIHSAGGNTSFQGQSGSQSNGGCFAERGRPLEGVSGFAVPRWP